MLPAKEKVARKSGLIRGRGFFYCVSLFPRILCQILTVRDAPQRGVPGTSKFANGSTHCLPLIESQFILFFLVDLIFLQEFYMYRKIKKILWRIPRDLMPSFPY